jgi:DNA-binding NarL/FixJ family response regulator
MVITSTKSIDLIILDIGMSKGKGKTLHEVLWSLFRHTRAMIVIVYPGENQRNMVPNAVDLHNKSQVLVCWSER